MRPPEAQKLQNEIHRQMGGEERLRTAFNLSNLTRKMMIEGINHQRPGISVEELKKQIKLRTAK